MSALLAAQQHAQVLAAGGQIEVGEHIQGKLFGLTFNLDTIWGTIIAGAVVCVFGLLVTRKASAGVPTKPQLIWESVVGLIDDQVEENLGRKAPAYLAPMAIALFMFITIANWLELIPTDHLVPSPTGDINLPLALGLFVIILMHVAAARSKGTGKWAYDTVFDHGKAMAILTIISEVVKPFTLALRLFGNILAGGIMISIIGLLPSYVLWLPHIIWVLFDMGIGVLQGAIFALLTIIYFGFQLVPHEEEGETAHQQTSDDAKEHKPVLTTEGTPDLEKAPSPELAKTA